MVPLFSVGLLIIVAGVMIASPFAVFGMGIYILQKYPFEPFGRMAGWLTLKPILGAILLYPIFDAAPRVEEIVWDRWSVDLSSSIIASVLIALMGVSLTTLIALPNRSAFHLNSRSYATTLLFMDVLRWGSTAFMYLFMDAAASFGFPGYGVGMILLLLAASMPLIFAVTAFNFVKAFGEEKDIKKKEN